MALNTCSKKKKKLTSRNYKNHNRNQWNWKQEINRKKPTKPKIVLDM